MRTFMIVMQVLGGLSFIPWMRLAGLSFLVFASPRAIRKIYPWVVVLLIFSYPFCVFGSFWWAWSNFLMRNPRLGCFWSCVPLVVFPILYLIIRQTTDLFEKDKKYRDGKKYF